MNKLGNQMVLDWTIESALNAKRISNVIVTTPDDEIIEYIKNIKKVKTFKRNWQMARFGITVDQTLTDLFHNLPKNLNHFQSVCVLYIEYPFRNSKFIDMSLDTMDIFGQKE